MKYLLLISFFSLSFLASAQSDSDTTQNICDMKTHSDTVDLRPDKACKEGDILKFGRNEEVCTILNARQVSYGGESWFLSNLTNKLLDRTGPMHGAPYWYYNGQNLQDIYNETYSFD